jgi:hypothetical protein
VRGRRPEIVIAESSLAEGIHNTIVEFSIVQRRVSELLVELVDETVVRGVAWVV